MAVVTKQLTRVCRDSSPTGQRTRVCHIWDNNWTTRPCVSNNQNAERLNQSVQRRAPIVRAPRKNKRQYK